MALQQLTEPNCGHYILPSQSSLGGLIDEYAGENTIDAQIKTFFGQK